MCEVCVKTLGPIAYDLAGRHRAGPGGSMGVSGPLHFIYPTCMCGSKMIGFICLLLLSLLSLLVQKSPNLEI